MSAIKEFLGELGDRKMSVAVFLSIAGALVAAGIAMGGAMFELSNVNKKVNAIVGKANTNAESIARLEGQMKDKNEVMRAISNQAAQNSTYINAIADKL